MFYLQGMQCGRFWHNNGLSVTLFVLFLLFLAGQSLVGLHEQNEERIAHLQSMLTYLEYVTSSGFLEVTMENWESESGPAGPGRSRPATHAEQACAGARTQGRVGAAAL